MIPHLTFQLLPQDIKQRKCLTKETAQQKVQTKIKIKRINEDMYFRNDAHTCNEENKRLGLDFSCQIGLCSKHGE